MTHKQTTMLPCPFCGKEVDLDCPDTLYPSGIVWVNDEECYRFYGTRKQYPVPDGHCYTLHCNNGVGCGAQMHGDSAEEVIEQWNRRI